MLTYAIWNNKGGTGKTSLTFQAVCRYAQNNLDKRILTVDMCPQANISELLLGGLENNGSKNLLKRQGMTPRCSIGGYFDTRMPSAHQLPQFDAGNYITNAHQHNKFIPKTIDLVCGDPLLEIQAIAMNSLANIQIPGVNTWLTVIDWLRDFLGKIKNDYDVVFIDTNPSFSMYTQIALAATDRIILPVMADDSSRRAIQNAFSLIYGIKLPSPVYEKYTFASKMKEADRQLPKVHLILKNRLTQYMGPASAYAAVLSGIDSDLGNLLKSHNQYFTFDNVSNGVIDIRDFGTTGVAAFACGTPFGVMKTGKLKLGEHCIQVNSEYRDLAIKAVDVIVTKL
ncbi:MAG TPA: ParA family protein [Herbaspirillum sp.]|nr:ParA family protein [Herbaspirillum sp.]